MTTNPTQGDLWAISTTSVASTLILVTFWGWFGLLIQVFAFAPVMVLALMTRPQQFARTMVGVHVVVGSVFVFFGGVFGAVCCGIAVISICSLIRRDRLSGIVTREAD